ncbi:DUF397 domain-containing protein, partial [Streptomyces sp. NPDC059142]|uniref:DUF397 domain-containing protein n=1 Tax=Streptomyces sp. NPDC059142 TaxID=3346739 RepID=UPI0036A98D5E
MAPPVTTYWIKSSHSSNEGAACVEVATAAGAVFVRDSKDIRHPSLGFTTTAWADFVPYASERGGGGPPPPAGDGRRARAAP